MYTFELTMYNWENDTFKNVEIKVFECLCVEMTEKEVFICAMSKAYDTIQEYGKSWYFDKLTFISC